MFKPTIFIAVALFLTVSYAVFEVENRVQYLRNELKTSQKTIATAKHDIEVLRAEWTYLNRPDRIRDMAERYLKTESITVSQVQDIETIPFRNIVADADSGLWPVADVNKVTVSSNEAIVNVSY